MEAEREAEAAALSEKLRKAAEAAERRKIARAADEAGEGPAAQPVTPAEGSPDPAVTPSPEPVTAQPATPPTAEPSGPSSLAAMDAAPETAVTVLLMIDHGKKGSAASITPAIRSSASVTTATPAWVLKLRRAE